MEDDSNGIIRLKSKDEKVFEIPERAANISELVMDSPREEDDEITEIEIARVNSDCLEKVVEFMKHYDEEKMKDIPTPLGGSTFNEVSSETWLQK
jgi:S-phase kinase-associated protein 1